MANKKSLFKNGKIALLLDRMQDEAADELEKVENEMYEKGRYHEDYDYLARQQKVYDDTYEMVWSLRKYVPFIEAGAMTLAEAITCESRREKKDTK